MSVYGRYLLVVDTASLSACDSYRSVVDVFRSTDKKSSSDKRHGDNVIDTKGRGNGTNQKGEDKQVHLLNAKVNRCWFSFYVF